MYRTNVEDLKDKRPQVNPSRVLATNQSHLSKILDAHLFQTRTETYVSGQIVDNEIHKMLDAHKPHKVVKVEDRTRVTRTRRTDNRTGKIDRIFGKPGPIGSS